MKKKSDTKKLSKKMKKRSFLAVLALIYTPLNWEVDIYQNLGEILLVQNQSKT